MKLLFPCCSVLPLYFWASVLLAQADPARSFEVTPQDLALDRYAVAVLPLKIVSDDPSASEFAGAVYEALVDELLSIDGVYVVDSGLVLPYSGSDLSPTEIARVVGVGNVVSGEISTHDDLWTLGLEYRDARGGERPGSSTSWARFKRVGPGESEGLPDLVEVRDRVAEFTEYIGTSLFPELRPDQQQVIAEMQAKILDASLSDAERVTAVDAMPHVRNASSSYVEARSQAFSGSVASALAQIATGSDNARLRLRIWTALSDVDDPNLISPLLVSLETDPNDAVRIEAALRLTETFRDAPGVQGALDYAVNNDPSEGVRKSIRFATLSEADQEQVLRATILDSSAPYNERVSALQKFQFNDGAYRDLGREIVVLMVDMARSADTPRARYRVWVNLTRTEDPYVVEPLIEELEAASSDDMKTLAVRVLGRFLDYPGVRGALEQVAARDASMKIRQMASEALDGPNR